MELYPDKVEVYGPGVEPMGIQKNQPTSFTVDSRKAGHAPLDVKVLDADYNELGVNVARIEDGVSKCSYVPKDACKHTIMVNYGGVAVKNSPFRVFVDQPMNVNNVFVFGPGVENGVKANVPTHFNVNCREAGSGNLAVSVRNEDTRKEVSVKVSNNGDGTYTVDYEPLEPGLHTATLQYGGLVVPTTPVKFNVEPNVDVSKIIVEGLEPSKFLFNYQHSQFSFAKEHQVMLKEYHTSVKYYLEGELGVVNGKTI